MGSDSSHTINDVFLVDGLKFNLLSVSQLCDSGNKVIFDKDKCTVQDEKTREVVITASRSNNVYSLVTNTSAGETIKSLKALKDDPKLWHRKLGHISMHTLNKLVSKDLVRGFTKT